MHEKAAKGYQSAADAYERGRPEYPREAVGFLLERLLFKTGQTIVDIGAGTGKLTKLLRLSGANVVAVEPVEAMRKKFSAVLPEIEILDGRSEAIPLPDGCVDGAIVATAFHWFDGRKSLAEIHRILKPSGMLGLIWNVRDESSDSVAKLTSIIDPFEGNTPRYRNMEWKKVFQETKLFSSLELKQFYHAHSGTHDMVVDRVASISFIAALPEKQRQLVLEEVRSLLESHPQTKGMSRMDIPYRTDVFWCGRI
ncbi:MAG: class I SAM-dependent methyltransferase [Oligoflexales bacterium]